MATNISMQTAPARVVASLAISFVFSLSVAYAGRNDQSEASPLREVDFRRVAQVSPTAPSDPLQPAPDPKDFFGRSFELVVIPVQYSSQQCDSGATWRYDADRKELRVLYSYGTFVMPDLKHADGRAFEGLITETDLQRYVSASCSRQLLPSYRASNAFGATVSISRSKQTLIALAENGREWGAAIPKSYPTILEWHQQVEPEVARAILPYLRVRVAGVVSRWSSGRVMLCGQIDGRPDLAHPTDNSLSGCFISVRSHTFEVFDHRNGQSLGNLEDVISKTPEGWIAVRPGFP